MLLVGSMQVLAPQISEAAPPSGVGLGNGLQMFLKSESGATSAATSTPFNSGTCFVGVISNLNIENFNSYSNCGTLNGSNREGITAHIRGYLLAPATESFSFWSLNDDGVLVSINGTQVINNWTDTGPAAYGTFNTNSAANSISLTQGRIYPIEIQFHQNGVGSMLKVYWSYPSCSGCNSKATAQLIPQAQLGTSSADLGTECAIGATEACPANSAMEIKLLTGTNTDGLYWITANGRSTQVYSLMNSNLGGGGWQLAMKGKSSASTFGYSSPYWTDTATVNEGTPSRISASDTDAKYSTFFGSFANQMMALFPNYPGTTYGGAYPSAGYGFAWSESLTGMTTWTGASSATLMTNGPQATGGCRTTPSNLKDMFASSNRCLIRQVAALPSGTENYPSGVAAGYKAAGNDLFATQYDVRFWGINYGMNSTSADARARWGFGFNENGSGNESSNDVLGGIGLAGRGTITAGTYMGCCSATGGSGQAGVSGNTNGSQINMAFELYVRESGVQFTSSAQLRTTAGTSASLTLTSTRSAGATSTIFNIPGLPSGVTLNSSTGVLTADATLAAGTYYETATAIDDTGAHSTLPLKITITPVASETDTAIALSGSQFLSASNESAFDVSSGTTFTLEAWVKPSVNNASQILIGKDNQYSLYIYSNGSYGMNFFTTNTPSGSGGDTSVFRANSVRINEWQHVALVRNGANVTGYVNGQQLGTFTNASATDSIKAGDSPFVIGGYSTLNQAFTGQIDQVRVWSTARTTSELQAGMHTFLPASQTGLIAMYGFNESVGERIYNNASGATWDTDLTLNGGSVSPAQIAETSTSGVYSAVTFNRSYLTAVGGWKPTFESKTVTVLAVGGGGGGGGGFTTSNTDAAGGGGGGGVFELSRYPLQSSSKYRVNVGMGGLGGNSGTDRASLRGFTGFTTTFESLTAGGGGGGGNYDSTNQNGLNGTAGGGGGGASNYWNATTYGSGGTGSNLTIAGATYSGRNGGAGRPWTGIPSTAGAGGGAGGAASGSPYAVGAGISSNLSGSSVEYGKGGGAYGVSGWSFTSRKTIPGTGGDGVYNQNIAGGDAANGIIIIRWITASSPTYIALPAVDTTTALTRYTFKVGGSATSPLSRSYQWQSTTNDGVSWTTQQSGSSDSYTTNTLDLASSGSSYKYRVIVTDSDTAGLSISDSSTSYLVLNRYPTITPPTAATSGLLVNLDAGETSSYSGTGTTWSDISGGARNASLGISSGGPAVSGYSAVTCSAPTYERRAGGIFTFTGNSTAPRNCAWISGSSLSNVGETYTVEMWVNPATEAQGANTALISTPWSSGEKINFTLAFNGTSTSGSPNIYGGVFDGTNWYETPVTPIAVGSWSHLVLTSSNRTLTLYVNGESKQTRALNSAPGGANKGVLIGRRWDANDTFNGSIGTVRISNQALSLEQVRQNYYASSNRFSASVSGVKSSSKTYATTYSETFTANNGTGIKNFSFSPNNRAGISWDTSTANLAVLNLSTSLNAGTYFETLTATDSATASTSLALTITVNKARQATVTIGQYNAFVGTSTYPINVYGGSSTGSITRTLTDSGTAQCVLAGGMMLTASRVGACSVQAVKAGDSNYFSETATATIYWIQWSDAYATRIPSTPTEIVLQHQTQIIRHAYETLTVTSYTDTATVPNTITSARPGQTIRILGTGFVATDTSSQATFTDNEYADRTDLTNDYIQVVVPDGAVTGPITVDTLKGTALGPTLTITSP